MKKYLLLLSILIVSCSGTPSEYKVQYDNGREVWVPNSRMVNYNIGERVIVFEYYPTERTIYNMYVGQQIPGPKWAYKIVKVIGKR